MGAEGTCPQMSTLAFNCHLFATKVPFTKGPERPQMCTIADECAQVTESGLKPGPHLRAPIWTAQSNSLETNYAMYL